MNRRIAAEARGRGSETVAAWALRLKGYRILGCRLKTRLGEIDMAAPPLFGPVCFIEVKARTAEAAALLSRTGSGLALPAPPTYISRAVRICRDGAPASTYHRGARALAPASCRRLAAR